jgi:ABC-type phosphate transport system substrate-binding protein
VGAGALDAVPAMVGSDTLKNLTQQVLNNCTALQTLSNPIKYDGTGSGAGENALKVIAGGTQLIAPMSRALGSGICTGGPTAAQRAGAEGMIVALDGLAIVANTANAGVEGIDYPGNAQDPANQWRTVLRLVYTGMDVGIGNNVFLRDCNSSNRMNIVNNWDNVFHGTVTTCTDSHPSVPGAGAAGYDQSNAIVEPGIRHAFRRDDESGTTDVFLGQLSLAGVNFAQGAPSGSNTVQTAVYRALAGSPFCNNKRPEDKWAPVTMPANATFGYNASQIPEMTNVGVPTGAGTGLGFSTQLKGSANAKNMAPYVTEYMDQDPIRRKCVGRGSNAAANLPFEQVCGADGTLGLVLPITIPAELTNAERYPSLPCEPGKGFFFGPALTRPTTDPMRCPNGDATQDSQCLLPVRTDLSQPGGIAFDCINPPGNVPQAVFDTDGDGSSFTDSPNTDGRIDVDGRVYNLVLRKPDGTIRTVLRNDPSKVGTFQTPVAAAYYRIHTTRSLGLPPAHTANTCATQDDATDQIGCLTLASPCSIGYAGKGAVTSNPGASSVLVNGIPNNTATVQALVKGGLTYPIARKLYLNTVQGFDILHNSSAAVPGTDAEEELAKCFATLPFNGTINLESPTIGFVKVPPATGATQEKPLCEDFNGSAATNCADATANTDACIGNDAISGGVIPSSICDNGLKDGAETGVDICQSGTSCNATTHHCQ